MTAAPLLEATDLTVRFGNVTASLHHLSVEILTFKHVPHLCDQRKR